MATTVGQGRFGVTLAQVFRQSARRLGNDLDRSFGYPAKPVALAIFFEAETGHLFRKAFDLIAHMEQPQTPAFAGSASENSQRVPLDIGADVR